MNIPVSLPRRQVKPVCLAIQVPITIYKGMLILLLSAMLLTVTPVAN